MPIRSIDVARFNALAGYTRNPRLVALVQEFHWFESDDGRVLGVQTWDRFDRDFGWIALGRDERGQFRAIDVDSSLPSAEHARDALAATRTTSPSRSVERSSASCGGRGHIGRKRAWAAFLS